MKAEESNLTDLNRYLLLIHRGIFYETDSMNTFALVDFEDYNYLEEYGENLYRAVDGATSEQDYCNSKYSKGYLKLLILMSYQKWWT